MKQCTKCNKFRIEQEFGNNIKTKVCSPCIKTTKLTTIASNKVIKRYRKYVLKRFYGMTLEDYEKLLKQQNYQCTVCGSNKPNGRSENFYVDHDHITGKIRGLLCNSCNIALGLLNDDPKLIKKLLNYLEYNTSKNTQPETV